MISIIVLAHDKVDLTRRCLESLCRSQLVPEGEILLVDNASRTSLEPLAEEFGSRVSSFRLFRNQENLSFSIANNRAAASAKGRWLAFLNNDVIVSPNSFAEFVSTFLSEPNTGVAGAKLLYPDNCTVQHAGMAQMLWGYASNYAVGACATDERIQQKKEMWAVTGAMLCVDRELFARVGGFCEAYRWGYEDVDLCLRVRQAGKSVLYVPEATALHAESATLREERVLSVEDENYRIFRSLWDPLLVPRELDYLSRLRAQHITRVAVFGAGRAAAGLSRVLAEHGFEVAAFATSRPGDTASTFCGRPEVPLEGLKQFSFDRLMAGTQYFFQVEADIRPYDPKGQPIFPVIE